MIKFLKWIAGLQPTSCSKRVPREEDPPSIRGYFPRAVVVHPTKKDLAALEHLKLKPGVVQHLQPVDHDWANLAGKVDRAETLLINSINDTSIDVSCVLRSLIGEIRDELGLPRPSESAQ